MGKTHEWFGTGDDAKLIVSWLNDAGGRLISGSELDCEAATDGREVVVHFSEIGPVHFWPQEISLDGDDASSPRWRRAVLAKMSQERDLQRPQIDVDRSAVAGLQYPELRDDRYWVSGQVWFPTAKLRETFPDLNRICGRFERFLAKFPKVFDNTKGEDKCGFSRQLCTSDVIHKVYALPQAYEILESGGFMIEALASPGQYRDFRHRLQSNGHER